MAQAIVDQSVRVQPATVSLSMQRRADFCREKIGRSSMNEKENSWK
jgi:hypothetical protein